MASINNSIVSVTRGILMQSQAATAVPPPHLHWQVLCGLAKEMDGFQCRALGHSMRAVSAKSSVCMSRALHRGLPSHAAAQQHDRLRARGHVLHERPWPRAAALHTTSPRRNNAAPRAFVWRGCGQTRTVIDARGPTALVLPRRRARSRTRSPHGRYVCIVLVAVAFALTPVVPKPQVHIIYPCLSTS